MRACRLPVTAVWEGKTETVRRGLQLDEVGARCGLDALVQGTCAVNATGRLG